MQKRDRKKKEESKKTANVFFRMEFSTKEEYDKFCKDKGFSLGKRLRTLVIKDLKGESFDKLIWHTKEDIDVLPFYTKEDNEKYQLQVPLKQSVGWQITERVLVDDITTANKVALHALQNGTTAITFNLQNKSFNKDIKK